MNPATGSDPDPSGDRRALAAMEAQLAPDVYHQGRDSRGELATAPALTGEEMDEAGW